MIKLLSIIGTRPQIIKAAALHRSIQLSYRDQLQEVIIYTGQHFSANLGTNLIHELKLPDPNYHFNLISKNRADRIEEMNIKCQEILGQEKPDFVIVYGDTDTTLSGAKAALALKLPLVHIEAGMRSYNNEMPEEYNRIYCDQHSTLLFTASQSAYNNLIQEGFVFNSKLPISPKNPKVVHVGDVMYDNFLHFEKAIKDYSSDLLKNYNIDPSAYALVSIHRNYNTDLPERLNKILLEIHKYALESKFKFFLPLHPRTKKVLEKPALAITKLKIENNPYFEITPPLPYLDMLSLVKNAKLIITDSGGLQKEAYFAKKPCIILRSETEWTEIIESGSAVICDSDQVSITNTIQTFLAKENLLFPPIFGDGNAANKICEEIIKPQITKKS